MIGILFGSYGPVRAVLFLYKPGMSVWLEWLGWGRRYEWRGAQKYPTMFCSGKHGQPEHIWELGADRPGTCRGAGGPATGGGGRAQVQIYVSLFQKTIWM